MKRIFTTVDGKNHFTRSRWLTIKEAYNITKRHSLYDFATDENGYKPYQEQYNPGEYGNSLYYFIYQGRKYAVEQFVCIGSVVCPGVPYHFIDTDGKSTFITSVDFYGDLFHPLYAEFDEYCEKVRIYEEV